MWAFYDGQIIKYRENFRLSSFHADQANVSGKNILRNFKPADQKMRIRLTNIFRLLNQIAVWLSQSPEEVGSAYKSSVSAIIFEMLFRHYTNRIVFQALGSGLWISNQEQND